MNRFLRVTLCFLCLYGNISFSQNVFNNTKYQAEVGTYLSTSGQTPFWLRSNQYGIVPLDAQFVTVRGAAHKEYDSTKNELNKQHKFSYGYGLNTVINVGKANQILIPEAYLKVRFGAFEIYAGRRREIVGLVDTTLTSGSYIWSGNALPMPKIQISIPNYTSIIGHGLVSIKGAYAHGWFDNDRPFTKHVKLHQKSFYGRLGKENWKIKIYAGFNHNVQWGGESPFYSIDGKLPDGFKNYLFAVTGKRGAIQNSLSTSDFDANRVGNHLGTIDIGLDMKLLNSQLFLYRQNIYEDGSLFYLNNISDGLNGLSLKLNNTKFIKKITFEYLNTTSQGGNFFSVDPNAPPQLRGADSYFSNAQIRDGWTYKNSIIGTPFIQNSNLNTSKTHTKKIIENNRVRIYYLSFIGNLPKNIQYQFRGSISNNLGTYTDPTDKTLNQFSTLVSLSKKHHFLNGSTISLDITFDKGQLFSNTLGAFIRISKQLR